MDPNSIKQLIVINIGKRKYEAQQGLEGTQPQHFKSPPILMIVLSTKNVSFLENIMGWGVGTSEHPKNWLFAPIVIYNL